MSFWESGSMTAISNMFATLRDIIRTFVRDPNEADRLATQLMAVFADVVKTEISGAYWLAGNWRAIVMLLIAIGLTVRYIMGIAPDTISDYILFTILVIGLLGYKLDKKILELIAEICRLAQAWEKERRAIDGKTASIQGSGDKKSGAK